MSTSTQASTQPVNLSQRLVEAAGEKLLAKTSPLGRVDLLCIDELGHLELDRRGDERSFQVCTEKAKRQNSVAIASNDRLRGWTTAVPQTPACARPSSIGFTFGGNTSRPAPTPTASAPHPRPAERQEDQAMTKIPSRLHRCDIR